MLNRSDVVAAYLRSRDRQAQIARRARSMARENPDGVERLDLLITEGNAAAGRTLAELGLPPTAVITAILRDGNLLVPRDNSGSSRETTCRCSPLPRDASPSSRPSQVRRREQRKKKP